MRSPLRRRLLARNGACADLPTSGLADARKATAAQKKSRLSAQAAHWHTLPLYPMAFPGYDCAQTSGRLPFCVSVNVNQRINQQIFCSLCDRDYVSFFC